MKKLFLFTALFLFVFSVFAYGSEEYRFIDAEETEGKLIPIEGMDDCYITADSSGDCVYIVNKYLQKLSNSSFKCVYNNISYNHYVIVRYADTDDLSGFAVLDEGMNEVIAPNNYFRIHIGYIDGNRHIICERYDESGNVINDYYLINTERNYGFEGLEENFTIEDYSSDTDDLIKDRIEAADRAGLIPQILKYKWAGSSISRYEFAALAVNAIMLKENTDIYNYIKDNNITLDYDKYIDVVSPYVLLADELGLNPPFDGKYFYPEKGLKRQEAAYILNSLCNIFGIKTTPKETLFADDSEIADWAREAVYNVSGTPVDDTYVLAQIGFDRFMPDSIYYYYDFETAIMAVWRLYGFDSIDFESYTSKFNEIYIGCGLYAYQNNDGKWGVYGDGVNVEAFYELPCSTGSRFVAFNNIFTLILDNSYSLGGEDDAVTYYIFNGNELIKTYVYTTADLKADKPFGYVFDSALPVAVSGSNIVFRGYINTPWQSVEFIKRLVSEKIAGEGYNYIRPYGDVGFSAVEISTGKNCLLNADGSFKEYVN
ncbi:MAG: hypothetical protein LUC92_10700 [Clostridiales bacterium]|nr:hypothetical protein [Clostridiales bacterium]